MTLRGGGPSVPAPPVRQTSTCRQRSVPGRNPSGPSGRQLEQALGVPYRLLPVDRGRVRADERHELGMLDEHGPADHDPDGPVARRPPHRAHARRGRVELPLGADGQAHDREPLVAHGRHQVAPPPAPPAGAVWSARSAPPDSPPPATPSPRPPAPKPPRASSGPPLTSQPARRKKSATMRSPKLCCSWGTGTRSARRPFSRIK